MKHSLILALCLTVSAGAQESGKKRVACTIPAVRSIAAEIGGDDFECFALAKADENVHKVSPNPNLMRKVGASDLYIEVGLQLEAWSNEVANNCGNPRLFPGGEGHVIAAKGIPREEIPAAASRSEGDVHPEGNPHVWIDPLRAVRMAENIAAAFKKATPGRAAAIDERLARFRGRVDDALYGGELVKLVGSKKLARLVQDGQLWSFLESTETEGVKLSARIGGWLKKAAPLRGVKVVEFHRTWIYAAKLLGFEIIGSIEEKPGIEPGAKHLNELATSMKERKARLILVENFQGFTAPRRVAEETGAVVVSLPAQPGGEPGTEGYLAFIDHVVAKLVEGVEGK